MSNEQVPPAPLEISPDVLSAEILSAVIESFILQEGTDYGAVEISLAAKVRQVQTQIEKGDVKIIFDPNTESVTLVTAREWSKNKLS